MIIGIGVDLTDINRIAKTLNRFGDRFTHRVYTQSERQKSDLRLKRIESYARRFAAKEACAKALGTGFRKGVYWRDLEVCNLPSGQPTMVLSGGAKHRLEEITPSGMKAEILLSLTDEPPNAQALVIISAKMKEVTHSEN
ncbi:MAG: holo-ACP synthase [Rhodospirillaceae bacterium]|nr:holo-ACP synthase [Alphaproteobacteria bacterium]MBR72165.1 holo-ACP synthase [Rhodospirillaceae bacterium]